MEIQDVIDNVTGKNNIGVIEWICNVWLLLTILLAIPFLILMWVCIALPMLFVSESTKTAISLSDYIKNNLSRNGDAKPKIQSINKPNPTPKSPSMTPIPFTLPFTLKNTPDYAPAIGISSNQIANSFIALIRRIAIGYFKSHMQDDSEFQSVLFNSPTFHNNRLTIANANIIGQFIHDFVWLIMAENTPISNSHRLIYGTKYTPFLLEITDNFHPDKSVKGVQIYIESLMDYYVDKVLDNRETDNATKTKSKSSSSTTDNTSSTDDNKKQQKNDDSWLEVIIGIAFMAFMVYSGYHAFIENDSNTNQTKETITNQAPDLIAKPLPNTGDTDNPNFYGNNPLKIKTKYGKNYWIKISNSINDVAMASYFIRGGDTLNITVPTGSYTIKYASGDSWYGTTHLFGKETQYAKADEVFEFNNNGYTIELIYQTHGNLHTKDLNANQF